MTAGPLPVPAPAAVDARQRAWRTLVQGLAVDVAVAVLLAAGTQLGDVRWTREYWGLLGALVAKTALTSAASYIARHVTPPSTG